MIVVSSGLDRPTKEILEKVVLLEPVVSRSVWMGADLQQSTSWITSLDESYLQEFERLLGATKDDAALDCGVSYEFSEPVSNLIAAMIDDLGNGRGFSVVRGLPVHERFTADDATRIYCAIGRKLGELVSQNTRGERIGNIWNRQVAGALNRGYENNTSMDFHTDSKDIVGLLCVREPVSGGESLVVSTMQIFIMMLERHPDEVPVLFKDFAWDKVNEELPGEPGWYERPLFSYVDGYLSGSVATNRIISATRLPDVARLFALEMSCLLHLQQMPWTPGVALSMTLQPGDMQFLHDHVVSHSRTGFVDDPTDESYQRHLLRLWISRFSGGRPVSAGIADRRRGVIPKVAAPA